MILRGIELEFNAFCPEDLEKYEKARKKVGDKYGFIWDAAKLPKDEQEYIALLKQGINAFADFFDTIFGKGTGNRLFGEKTDFVSVIDIYLEFARQVQEQAITLQEKVAAFAPDKAQP